MWLSDIAHTGIGVGTERCAVMGAPNKNVDSGFSEGSQEALGVAAAS